jgi:hypothetical protein
VESDRDSTVVIRRLMRKADFVTAKSANPKVSVLLTVKDVLEAEKTMAHQRVALWAAEPDLDNDINDVDVDIPIPIPSSTNEMYDDPNLQLDEGSLQAMQQHIAQQAAFEQIPDIVKRVSILSFGS